MNFQLIGEEGPRSCTVAEAYQLIKYELLEVPGSWTFAEVNGYELPVTIVEEAMIHMASVQYYKATEKDLPIGELYKKQKKGPKIERTPEEEAMFKAWESGENPFAGMNYKVV